MGFDVNVNDAAPQELAVERQLEDITCGPDSALILTDAREKTPTGIFLPRSVQDMVNTGVVVSIGVGGHDFAGHHIPPVAKPGDQILFGMLSKAFKLEADLGDGKKDYFLIDQDEILAVLKYKAGTEDAPAPMIEDVGAGV